MQITALVLLFAFIGWLVFSWKRRVNNISITFSSEYCTILNEKVLFFQKLNTSDKIKFETRMSEFLSTVSITGIDTTVEALDTVLVAASAIIPIFAFSNWRYNNLNEVLLYPQSFNEQFNLTSEQDKPIIGMVGTGAMHRVMILSKPALREGFSNKLDKNNTGVNEFVHLIDKSDGETDGVPENLLDKQYILPWINLIHENLKEILADKSDINPYGATNKVEFFAVVSEYFFERPDTLKIKHPQLYQLLEKIFKQNPAMEPLIPIVKK